jgi:hypothetical protein
MIMEHIFYYLDSKLPFREEYLLDQNLQKEEKNSINFISLLKSISKSCYFQSFPPHILQYSLNPISKTHHKIHFSHPAIRLFPPYFLQWGKSTRFGITKFHRRNHSSRSAICRLRMNKTPEGKFLRSEYHE